MWTAVPSRILMTLGRSERDRAEPDFDTFLAPAAQRSPAMMAQWSKQGRKLDPAVTGQAVRQRVVGGQQTPAHLLCSRRFGSLGRPASFPIVGWRMNLTEGGYRLSAAEGGIATPYGGC
jgi:hypothetical protein